MRALLRKLVDLGLDADTPLDLVVAGRATNTAALGMVAVTIASAVAALVDARSPMLALGCVTLGLAYGVCLLLRAVGRLDGARWLIMATGSLNYLQYNLAVGHAGGGPVWIVAFVAFPVLAFTRLEQRKALVAYVWMALVFVVTDLLSRAYGPLVIAPEAAGFAYTYTVVMVAVVIGFGLHYYKNSSIAVRADLDAARLQISELLDNMLPPSIVLRLGRGEQVIADSHGEASVLFADLTGFSELARRLSPTHLVEVLNRLFSRFDEAAAHHGIEKIKTIGDCYMAATGVLEDHLGHAALDAMADFALEMPAIVEEVGRESGLRLGIRVGISSGSVVSGVIGTRRFNFDVWGDTVNLASQMESMGVAGRIQVSESAYWRLQGGYRFESRGEVTVKSGTRLQTYFLPGRAAPEEPSAHPPRLANA